MMGYLVAADIDPFGVQAANPDTGALALALGAETQAQSGGQMVSSAELRFKTLPAQTPEPSAADISALRALLRNPRRDDPNYLPELRKAVGSEPDLVLAAQLHLNLDWAEFGQTVHVVGRRLPKSYGGGDLLIQQVASSSSDDDRAVFAPGYWQTAYAFQLRIFQGPGQARYDQSQLRGQQIHRHVSQLRTVTLPTFGTEPNI